MRRLSITVILIRSEKAIFPSVQINYITLFIGAISRPQSVKAFISWSLALRTSHSTNCKITSSVRIERWLLRFVSGRQYWTCMWHEHAWHIDCNYYNTHYTSSRSSVVWASVVGENKFTKKKVNVNACGSLASKFLWWGKLLNMCQPCQWLAIEKHAVFVKIIWVATLELCTRIVRICWLS